MIKIELCSIQDLPLLFEFINDKWKVNHALFLSRELMNWQHLNSKNNCYNFLLAKETETNEILGILGFINTAQYDNELDENGDYYGAIWKIDNTNQNAIGLGHSLFKKLQKLPNFKTFGAIGISNDTKNYMRIINFRVEKLTQYYIINNSISNFKIAEIKNYLNIQSEICNSDFSLKKIDNLSCIDIKTSYKPKKTINYLINKYQLHPIYKYIFYGIFKESEILAVFVMRKIELFNSSCIRIVDCIGDLSNIGSLYNDFQKLLKNENSEYIDFFNFGINPPIIQSLGFEILDEKDFNIIPNYFEPFEKKNIILECAFNSTENNYVFFKGDSDQDRPNVL